MADGAVLKGRGASPGRVTGPLVHLPATRAATVPAIPLMPADEALRFEAAVAEAARELDLLMESADGMAAEMLSFQRLLLDEEDVLCRVRAGIGSAPSAADAWRAVMDEEIAAFADDGDDLLAARAADLRDLRDRILDLLAGAGAVEPALPEHAVIAADELVPSRFIAMDWDRTGGIALSAGSSLSHVAMLARSRGVPMAVGLGRIALADGTRVTLDGAEGTLRATPDAPVGRRAGKVAAEAAPMLEGPAVTRSGETVETLINIMTLDDLARPEARFCDGIGLVRSEFLFEAGPPGEDEQYAVYRQIVDWAAGRPVVIRTIDAGGDKPIAGLTLAGEANPFLGLRGIRLSLARPDHFKRQLKALARAAAHGPLDIMLPMVTVPGEVAASAALLDEAMRDLEAAATPARRPRLGMMVEVPSAAIAVDRFEADFYSVGSNDLTQFVLACDRANGAVADLYDPLDPAVLRLIGLVAEHGARSGRKVSVCGEMAADSEAIRALFALGVRSLSVSVAAIAATKAAVAGL